METYTNITSDYYNVLNQSSHFGNISQQESDSSTLFIQMLRRSYLTTLPVICITGVIGNALSFFVFVSKPLRRTSCSWYLAARSISDGGFLFASFLTWASDASKQNFFHTQGLCQVIVFMTYVFAFMSVWLTVVVTIENYVRICRPFSVQTFCNIAMARRTIICLIPTGVILYNYPFWTSNVFDVTVNNTTVRWCAAYREYIHLLKWLSFLDMLTTLVIPTFLIVILMIAITFSLIKSLKRQSRLQSGSNRSSRVNGQPGTLARSSKPSSSPQAKVTRMLFAVSFFFILLNGPSHVIRMKMVIVEILGTTHGAPSVEEQVQVVFQFIYNLSFAVNLVIYLTCGDNFRKQFKDVFFSICFRRPSPKKCSEATALTVVKIEKIDHGQDQQTALIDSGTGSNTADKIL